MQFDTEIQLTNRNIEHCSLPSFRADEILATNKLNLYKSRKIKTNTNGGSMEIFRPTCFCVYYFDGLQFAMRHKQFCIWFYWIHRIGILEIRHINTFNYYRFSTIGIETFLIILNKLFPTETMRFGDNWSKLIQYSQMRAYFGNWNSHSIRC